MGRRPGLAGCAGARAVSGRAYRYEHADGRLDHEDLELATGHYNSRQLAAKQAAGFQMSHSSAGQLRGGRAGRGGSPFDPHAAERVLR